MLQMIMEIWQQNFVNGKQKTRYLSLPKVREDLLQISSGIDQMWGIPCWRNFFLLFICYHLYWSYSSFYAYFLPPLLFNHTYGVLCTLDIASLLSLLCPKPSSAWP